MNMKQILKKRNGVFFVMLLLLITKILGFLKLRTIAQLFGVTHELDIFWAAFTIPDMLFMILVAGSINAAVIPILSETFFKKGEKRLNRLFNYLTLIVFFVSTLIALVLFIFTSQLTRFIIHSDFAQKALDMGSRISQDDFDLFVKLTRIMLLSPILLGVSTFITAYLQVRKQFFITSLAPLFYNLAMIVGSWILVSFLGMGVEGVAISAVLGSLLHLLIQIPKFKYFYKAKFRIGIKDLVTAFKDKSTHLAFKLTIPRTIGILGEEFNTLINTLIGFSLADGALSAYKFALSLHLFPVNIVGSSFAQVVLPDLSECNHDREKFAKILNNSIQSTLFLVFPIVAVILVLKLPLVRLAYGTGAFDWRGTILTAWCLVLFSLSVIGQSVVQILLRAFYALKETWTPLIAITVGIIVNIVLALLLTNFFSHYYDWRPILEQIHIQITEANGQGVAPVLLSFVKDTVKWSISRGESDYAVGGLSLSISISFIIQAILLMLLLNRGRNLITWRESIAPAIKKIFNTVLMSIGMYLVFKLFDFQLDTTKTISIVILTIITTTYGLSSYWLGCKIFGIKEVSMIDDFLLELKDNFFKKQNGQEVS